MGYNRGVVDTAVLRHNHPQVVEGIAHGIAHEVELDINLLVGVVVVDIGSGTDLSPHLHSPFRHHEAHLQNDFIGVILGVDTQQIISRQGEAEIGIGKRERIVHIVG